MLFSPKRRRYLAVISMVLLTGTGAIGGYLLGRQHTRLMTLNKLAGDATRSLELVDSLLDEAHTLLNDMNASPYAPCSDAEITWFRKLIFHSVNHRDAGRMQDGRFKCSAEFPQEGLPHTRYEPTFTRQEGMVGYRSPSPYGSPTSLVFVFQKGDFYLVEDPNFFSRLLLVTSIVEVTLTDARTNKVGRASGLPSKIPAAIRDRPAQGQVGDLLYVTQCSSHNVICATAYSPLSGALATARGQILLDMCCGALMGAVLGLLVIVVHLRSRSLTNQLRRSIRKNRIQVVYQPIVEVGSRRVVEAEALVRWNSEDGKAVSPEVFVRLAEECKCIGELTRLVVQHVLSDFGDVLRSDPEFTLNINVTAADLQDPHFLPMLEQSLARERVAARSLAIEVTESSMARTPAAMETIRELRQRGYSIQIDDFGTGYSSLAYLHDFPVDTIKIDRTFTKSIGTGAVTAAILPQILALSETLGLRVIVEGIETEEQANYFVGLERQVLGQGWLFGRPVTANQFISNLNKAEDRIEMSNISA